MGCGKTTLIRHLLGKLGKDVTVGLISNTRQEISELLEWVLLSFGQPCDAELPELGSESNFDPCHSGFLWPKWIAALRSQ